MLKWIRLFSLLLVVMLLAACRERGKTLDDVPTRIPSVDALATADMLTANAPPPGYRESVSFPQVDDNLPRLESWRYEVLMAFDGVFAGTPRPVTGRTTAQVWFRQLGPTRRVVIEGEGELVAQEEGVVLEGVRLGSDTFLVRDNTCLGDAGGDAAVLADLRAGDLIGGVTEAIPAGAKGTINGEEVWRYDFTQEELVLPQIDLGDRGSIIAMSGELWVAPEHDAVIRFYLTLNVENAFVFNLDDPDALPVTGTVTLRYDLYDIGVDPNITQPFGC